MCGIAGVVTTDPNMDNDHVVGSMIRALKHRGPDSDSVVAVDLCTMGHARLSIIDIEGGQQPMSSHDKRFCIVFNGEIYNYQELRNALKQKGCYFKTKSDTEVIMEAYRIYKDECVRCFNGMFAFAIWDNDEKKLFASRDRLGQKPFYYSVSESGTFFFASEVKAMIAAGSQNPVLDYQSMDAYLSFGYIPPDRCIYKNINTLLPGHVLYFTKGRTRINKYWEIQFNGNNDLISETEAIENLHVLLDRSVKYRLIADVPVGAFLSGGKDSSTIVHYAQKKTHIPLRTFSVGFGSIINELPIAGEVALQEHSDHHEINLGDIHVADLLLKMADIYDEPIGDSSCIPTYLVSEFASRDVKVALSGDGGDELFGGYDYYSVLERMSTLPHTGILYHLYNNVLKLAAAIFPIHQLHRQLWELNTRRIYPDLYDTRIAVRRWFHDDERRQLWNSKSCVFNEFQMIDPCPQSANGLDKVFYVDLQSFFRGQILPKLDRASMAVGLETRCPFLDPELVDFMLSLPSRFKINNGETRYLFKKAFQDCWPDAVKKHKKIGFHAPHFAWLLRSDVQELIHDVVLNVNNPIYQLVSHKLIKSMFNDFKNHHAGDKEQLWSVLVLALWFHRWNPSLT